MTKTREQIKKERISKGFCVCHECIERDYEQNYWSESLLSGLKPLKGLFKKHENK